MPKTLGVLTKLLIKDFLFCGGRLAHVSHPRGENCHRLHAALTSSCPNSQLPESAPYTTFLEDAF